MSQTKDDSQIKPVSHLSEDSNIKDWSVWLKVTPDEIREAVKAVGSDAKAIENYFLAKSLKV